MAVKNKTRIFIECTQTFFHGGNSGIQRVVRNLANHGPAFSGRDFDVYPLLWTGFGFIIPSRKVKIRPYFMIRLKKSVESLVESSGGYLPDFCRRIIIRLVKLLFSPEQRKKCVTFLFP